eukprot:3939698-Rhodomonas_salina.1
MPSVLGWSRLLLSRRDTDYPGVPCRVSDLKSWLGAMLGLVLGCVGSEQGAWRMWRMWSLRGGGVGSVSVWEWGMV